MGGIGEFLKELVGWLYDFWPFRIVRDWEQGLRVCLGRAGQPLTSRNGLFGTGVHVFPPGVGEILVEEANVEVSETGIQTFTTRDRQTVTISFALEYRIKDMRRLYLGIHDTSATLVNATLAAAGRALSELNLDEIHDELEDIVVSEVEEKLGEWGVEVLALTPITFVVGKALRLIQGTD